jgi:hypothetical protein
MVTSLGGYHRFSMSGIAQRIEYVRPLFPGKSFANLRKDLHTDTHAEGLGTG